MIRTYHRNEGFVNLQTAGRAMTLLLTRTDVLKALEIEDCIAAVEEAFSADALGRTLLAGVLATHAELGTFHVKTAGLLGDRAYYAAKINANFPTNPVQHGLPTIQGVIGLHDAATGVLLALIDSSSITALRTAAATAVAAKYLARRDARTIAIAGCGVQARSQVRALMRVRTITSVLAYDIDRAASERFVDEIGGELTCDVTAVDDFAVAGARADIVVTCTTARQPVVAAGDVRPGAFVAAVGADSPEKHELDPALVAANTVVVDVLEQCVAFGELHHAIRNGVMSPRLCATLADVVSGRHPGRVGDSEITIFDSTGTGLEDVAAAAAAYERSVVLGLGRLIRLDD